MPSHTVVTTGAPVMTSAATTATSLATIAVSIWDLTAQSARAPRLEPELRCELYDSRIKSRGNRPETGGAELRCGCAEVHGVQQVEYFQTQLDRALTGKADSPHHREIDIAVRWTSHWIARSGSDRELIGQC